MKPTTEQFAATAICFIVLIDHHGDGYNEAHPNYILEKLRMIQMNPQDAYGMLDQENQLRVRRLLVRWGFELPEEIK